VADGLTHHEFFNPGHGAVGKECSVEAPEEVADDDSSIRYGNEDQRVAPVEEVTKGPLEYGALGPIRNGECLYQRSELFCIPSSGWADFDVVSRHAKSCHFRTAPYAGLGCPLPAPTRYPSEGA
jgi:hypothetical protein